MNLVQKINKEEERYFNENLQVPDYLIMSPAAREELKFTIGEEEGKDIEIMLEEELNTYKGMTVAICLKLDFPDFVLC